MGVTRKGTRHKPGVPAAYHKPHRQDPGRCGACGNPWPCSTAAERDG